jgi:hypothetical protein
MRALLDDGLDELAAKTYQGFPQRMATTAIVAALASNLLAWQACALFLLAQSISEGVCLLASRRQFLGFKASPRQRLLQLSTVGFGCISWMTLGALLWSSGTAAGAVTGMTLWLSVIFFAQSHAYQSPLGFVVGGALPGAGILIWCLAFAPNPLNMPKFPVFGLMIMSLAFASDAVVRTLAARRKFEDAVSPPTDVRGSLPGAGRQHYRRHRPERPRRPAALSVALHRTGHGLFGRRAVLHPELHLPAP